MSMKKDIQFKSKVRYAVKRARPMTSRRQGLVPLRSANYLDILDLANCANPDSVFNVGIPLCDLAKKKMRGVIFTDQGLSFSGADIASVPAFIAAVKDATVAARGSRAYPMFDILNFEDSTGDPSTGGVGNLSTATIVTSDAVPTFRFGYGGSEARHKRVSAMIGAALSVLFVDEAWTVYGCDDVNGSFQGYDILQAYAYTSKFIIGDAVNQYSFRLTLRDITQYRDTTRYISANAGLAAAVGLINVQLSELSHASNVYKIKAVTDGGTDLEPLHGAALAALTWSAKNLEDGSVIDLTSIADDTSLDAFTVTVDSTDFGALDSGDRFQISGPSAAAMAAAGVKPFEMIPVVIVKP